jgi:hypothetical protein
VSWPAGPCCVGVDLLILVTVYSDRLFEATIAAAAACVFQCLSYPSGPALDQALVIVEKVNALNLRAVQSVLYERAKIFLDHFPHLDHATPGEHDDEVHSKRVSKEVELFSSRLIDILFGPTTDEAEPESTRMKRAVLAVAYANCAAASEAGRLTSILEQWLGRERSGPVRETITRALLAFRQDG